MHLAVQVYLVADIFLDGPAQRRAQDWMRSEEAATAILLFFVAFNVISIILIGQLIQFHRQLQRKNLTTYSFIVQDHKVRRERARREGDLEAQRVVLVAKAERERAALWRWRLQVGGACRRAGCAACDPLDLPEPPEEPDLNAGFAGALGGGGGGDDDLPMTTTSSPDEHDDNYSNNSADNRRRRR